jgi:NAD(P)-dependent dehydrogenase (short-subunit alcohol dehydrogenase family)
MSVAAWAPLAGRTAVVTGGSAGIGAGIVRLFAAAGAHGAVLDLAPPASVPAGWLTIEADVRAASSLAAAFERVERELGRVNALVAAAGVVPPWSSVSSLDLSEWDEVLAVNARGVAATLLHGLPIVEDGGSIVVIASLNAWRGDPNLVAYTASKHAALGIVRSAAVDLGRRGIRVNALAPGTIATDALLGRMKRREATLGIPVEEALETAARQAALGRIATVEEVAGAALFLASDLGSGITGQLLHVDAGVS